MNTSRTPQHRLKACREKGFTLIETLIAIAVLTLAIVGPFQIAQGVLESAYTARDQLIASGLAQDGMEYVRMIRDSDYLYNAYNGTGSVNWFSGLDGTNGPDCYSNTCLIDPTAYQPASEIFTAGSSVCSVGGTCTGVPALYLDSSNVYNQANRGTVTKFTRTMTLTRISTRETLITITVSWNNHGIKTFTLTENLQNWL